MTVELSKADLANLVKGSTPNYDVMVHPLVNNNGRYIGGFHDKWDWSLKSDMTEEQLWELYNLCKNSWK